MVKSITHWFLIITPREEVRGLPSWACSAIISLHFVFRSSLLFNVCSNHITQMVWLSWVHQQALNSTHAPLCMSLPGGRGLHCTAYTEGTCSVGMRIHTIHSPHWHQTPSTCWMLRARLHWALIMNQNITGVSSKKDWGMGLLRAYFFSSELPKGFLCDTVTSTCRDLRNQ